MDFILPDDIRKAIKKGAINNLSQPVSDCGDLLERPDKTGFPFVIYIMCKEIIIASNFTLTLVLKTVTVHLATQRQVQYKQHQMFNKGSEFALRLRCCCIYAVIWTVACQ